MKQLLPALIILVSSCGPKPPAIKNNIQDSIKVEHVAIKVDTPAAEVEFDPEMAMETYYIVQVDTGYNFDSLKAISAAAVSILGNKFSMLDRLYKPGKGIIAPENSEDEMYAGEYFPRRPYNDEDFVSIEMANWFCNNDADRLEMVSIAGMYAEKSQADSVTALLKGKIPTVKTIQRKVYMGCMH